MRNAAWADRIEYRKTGRSLCQVQGLGRETTAASQEQPDDEHAAILQCQWNGSWEWNRNAGAQGYEKARAHYDGRLFCPLDNPVLREVERLRYRLRHKCLDWKKGRT